MTSISSIVIMRGEATMYHVVTWIVLAFTAGLALGLSVAYRIQSALLDEGSRLWKLVDRLRSWRLERARRRWERREAARQAAIEPWEEYERRTREGWEREAGDRPVPKASPVAGGVLLERSDEVLFVPPDAGPADD